MFYFRTNDTYNEQELKKDKEQKLKGLAVFLNKCIVTAGHVIMDI